MAPKLRVLISNNQAYPPTALCPVNSEKPTPIKTDLFEGEVSVFVKGFTGEGMAGDGACYFDTRSDMTYGIIVRGRFLDNPNADDVVFGNIFEDPIRDSLPWGTAVATKFMYFIDPTLELDVYADKPWALSPALATMNYLGLSKEKPTGEGTVVKESALGHVGQEDKADNVSARRKYFADPGNREQIELGDVYTEMEFANGILDFNTLSATLPRPFSMSVPLLKYWDGQPVTYVCRRRPASGQSPVSPDGVYWAVAFEIVDEDAVAELERKGGKKRRSSFDESTGDGTGAKPSVPAPTTKEDTSEAVDVSDDVD